MFILLVLQLLLLYFDVRLVLEIRFNCFIPKSAFHADLKITFWYIAWLEKNYEPIFYSQHVVFLLMQFWILHFEVNNNNIKIMKIFLYQVSLTSNKQPLTCSMMFTSFHGDLLHVSNVIAFLIKRKWYIGARNIGRISIYLYLCIDINVDITLR